MRAAPDLDNAVRYGAGEWHAYSPNEAPAWTAVACALGMLVRTEKLLRDASPEEINRVLAGPRRWAAS